MVRPYPLGLPSANLENSSFAGASKSFRQKNGSTQLKSLTTAWEKKGSSSAAVSPAAQEAGLTGWKAAGSGRRHSSLWLWWDATVSRNKRGEQKRDSGTDCRFPSRELETSWYYDVWANRRLNSLMSSSAPMPCPLTAWRAGPWALASDVRQGQARVCPRGQAGSDC